jgi:pyruvate,water dikinase
MELPLRNLVGVHGTRLYYHLTNLHAVLRMAPLGEFLADSFNQFVGTGHTPPDGGRLSWTGFSPDRIGQWLEVSRIAAASLWQFAFVARRVDQFERTVDDFAAATTPVVLAGEPQSGLLNHLRRFMAIRCHEWLGASLADAAAMLSYGLLKRLLDAELSGQEGAAAHNSLLRGLCDVVSSAPATHLWELSRQVRANPNLRELFAHEPDDEVLRQLDSRAEFASFRDGVQQYLADWGFRCSGELMLTAASLQERPEGVIEILRAYAGVEGESPGQRLDRQQAEREDQTRRVRAVLRRRPVARFLPWPTKAFAFTRLLRWTQQAIVLRERARLKQALLYSRCRRIVLAIGDRLAAAGTLRRPDEAFFLTAAELEALLCGHSMFPAHTAALVELRRQAHAEHSRHQPHDTFTLPAGAYWQPDAAAADRSQAWPASSERVLRGSGVCGGVATGPAGVLQSASQLDKLSAGSILVTRQTDPGWAPVFPLIQGLVMERGGMLSHGAILAREYGLPTVVGVPDATERIKPGCIVTVDGDRGLVELT